MAIVLIVALVLMVVSVAKSENKFRTLLLIWGWTIALTALFGLAAFVLAKVMHAGNPAGIAGDIAGPIATFTLLISSAILLGKLRKTTQHIHRPE